MVWKRYIVGFITLIVAVSAANCGGGLPPAYDPYSDPALNSPDKPAVPEGATSWHNLLNSDQYSGYLAVMFREDSDVRLRSGKFAVASKSKNSDAHLNYLNALVSEYNVEIKRGMDLPEETIAKAVEKARREGKRLHDWNLFYKIRVEKPDDAEELFKELSRSNDVRWVHPVPIAEVQGFFVTTDAENIVDSKDAGGTTRDLTDLQTYLGSESDTGGLNIYPAWDAGITGEGVRINDQEFNWNFDHEDLPIDEEDLFRNPSLTPEELAKVNEPVSIQHGTAVVGILGGIDNGYGITGIAHTSEIKLAQITSLVATVAPALEDYISGRSGSEPYYRPGDIILIEVGPSHPTNTPPTGCGLNIITEEPTYCIPNEAFPLDFAAVHDMVELGIIVIEGAGNGGVDLSDPMANLHDCGPDSCPNMAADDSGSIIVAASNPGHDHTKPWWSNWGTRVNAYAWGSGVATTGFGQDNLLSYDPVPNPDSDPADPNKWYTYDFIGTSAAAAQVAGAVALAQSYAKDFYADILPHKKAYFDSWQMRELIQLTGTAGDPAYSMGKKPDVVAMMEAIANGDVLPHLAPDTKILLSPPNAVAGINYDIDRDGRDDLITFTPPSSIRDAGIGTWKIDLSSVAPPGGSVDNYGAWDISVSFNVCAGRTNSCILYPVVHDYDSDGDADLALYDSKQGIWYIKYTTEETLAPPFEKGGSGGILWDRVIDYSDDPMWRPYSRPMTGDFNGDNYLDVSLVRSDGHWVRDLGGLGHLEKHGADIVYVDEFGELEADVKFLTDEQLAAAPGWAYLVVGLAWGGTGMHDFVYKSPDVIVDGKKMYTIDSPDYDISTTWVADWYDDDLTAHDEYAGNEVVMTPYDYTEESSGSLWFYTYGLENDWKFIHNILFYILNIPEPTWTGSAACYPVTGDYNGDGRSDFALKCSDSWKIVYHDVESGRPPAFTLTSERIASMDDATLSLPPTIYPGGMKYKDIKEILEYYDLVDEYQNKDPFTPHTVQCIYLWGPPPSYCLAK